MNAYELANHLAFENIINDDSSELILKAIDMLRQQADRIAELEDRLSFYELKDLDTHPVKQLSDEEIANIWAEHTKVAGTYDIKDIVFPFARAIIKEMNK